MENKKIEKYYDLMEYLEKKPYNKEIPYPTITANMEINTGTFRRILNYPIVEKKFIDPFKIKPGNFLNVSQKSYGDNSIKIKLGEVGNEVNRLKGRIQKIESEHSLFLGVRKYFKNIELLPELKEDLKSKEVELLKLKQKNKRANQLDIEKEKASIKEYNATLKHELEYEDWNVILKVNKNSKDERSFKLGISELKNIIIGNFSSTEDHYITSFYIYIRLLSKYFIIDDNYFPLLEVSKLNFNNDSFLFFRMRSEIKEVTNSSSEFFSWNRLKVLGVDHLTNVRSEINHINTILRDETKKFDSKKLNFIKESYLDKVHILNKLKEERLKLNKLRAEILNVPGGERDQNKIKLETLKNEKIKLENEIIKNNVEINKMQKHISLNSEKYIAITEKLREILENQELHNKLLLELKTESVERNELIKRLNSLSTKNENYHSELKTCNSSTNEKTKRISKIESFNQKIKKKIDEINGNINSIRMY
jgi:hypothetical protein